MLWMSCLKTHKISQSSFNQWSPYPSQMPLLLLPWSSYSLDIAFFCSIKRWMNRQILNEIPILILSANGNTLNTGSAKTWAIFPLRNMLKAKPIKKVFFADLWLENELVSTLKNTTLIKQLKHLITKMRKMVGYLV